MLDLGKRLALKESAILSHIPAEEDILKKYDPAISSLALRLREYLLKELKGMLNIPMLLQNIIGYGYPGYKKMIYIIPNCDNTKAHMHTVILQG